MTDWPSGFSELAGSTEEGGGSRSTATAVHQLKHPSVQLASAAAAARPSPSGPQPTPPLLHANGAAAGASLSSGPAAFYHHQRQQRHFDSAVAEDGGQRQQRYAAERAGEYLNSAAAAAADTFLGQTGITIFTAGCSFKGKRKFVSSEDQCLKVFFRSYISIKQ